MYQIDPMTGEVYTQEELEAKRRQQQRDMKAIDEARSEMNARTCALMYRENECLSELNESLKGKKGRVFRYSLLFLAATFGLRAVLLVYNLPIGVALFFGLPMIAATTGFAYLYVAVRFIGVELESGYIIWNRSCRYSPMVCAFIANLSIITAFVVYSYTVSAISGVALIGLMFLAFGYALALTYLNELFPYIFLQGYVRPRYQPMIRQ